MSMDDYRSYYEQEEKPEPRPAGRWLGGLILGLILGGIIGFVIGSGNSGGFFNDMQGSFAGEGVWVVFTIIFIMSLAVLKSVFVRRGGSEGAQAIQWLLLMLGIGIAVALAFGVLFFAGS